ncbi:MAG: glycerophosphodiester phosphodiesterase [Bacteroidota bacterium]
MTRKFILYSMPFLFLFLCMAIFEPWIYRTLIVSSKIDKDLKERDFEIIAHKGASGMAPENTIPAIMKALELGVDMIEIDVRQTKDEQIVVFHDETLNRTTNGEGYVYDYTLEELKQLDAGFWHSPTFKGTTIPTLHEVLDSIRGKCKVLIEIKHSDHPHYEDFSEKLIDIIREEKNGFDWCILQSYEIEYLEAAHEYDDHIQTKKLLIGEDSAPLFAFYVETKMHLGRATSEGNRLLALNPEYHTLSTRRVFRMHARGYKVYTYPVNERENMIKMLHMGVDGIITDYPERLIQIKQEIQAL